MPSAEFPRSVAREAGAHRSSIPPSAKRSVILRCGLVLATLWASSASAQEPAPSVATNTDGGQAVAFTAPPLMADDKPLPIDLPSALRLAHVQALDISIATQQWRAAGAQLQGAKALWLPNVVAGAEYINHAGPLQGTDGTLTNSNRSSLYAGFAPLVTLTLTDAIFTPLAARQVARAQNANIRTATNDTLTSVAMVYFDAQEARAELGAVQDVLNKVQVLVNKVDRIAPELVPAVEKSRVRAQQANIEQIAETARRRWRVASAELDRILRLEPTLVLVPIEPPHLRITLIPPTTPPEELIPIAVARRPEVTFAEAQEQAACERVRQEKWRPFLPTVFIRGGGTQTPDPLMYGTYGGGPGGTLSQFGSRLDVDAQLIWEVRGLGFGNRALVREREANYETSIRQRARSQELVAREVTQSRADVVAAANRVPEAEREVQQALESANENLAGVGQIKRVGGNLNILVIRPQEAVSAIQALASAYFDYYGTVADYNRAQFQLYRALGNPADWLYRGDNPGAPQAMPPAEQVRTAQQVPPAPGETGVPAAPPAELAAPPANPYEQPAP
jgi:outer membrane protein TolC